MKNKSDIPHEPIQAFLETEFQVLGSSPFTLQVGQQSDDVAAAYLARGVTTCAFLTACNPFSQLFDTDLNIKRQLALAEKLKGRGLTFLQGVGQHPSNQWPGEDSFLVFGLSLDGAKTICVRLEQNGFIWCDADAIPQLILLR